MLTMNRKFVCSFLLGLVISAAVTAEPLVKLAPSNISYRGVARDLVEDFHNIKFAHDTSGQRLLLPQSHTRPQMAAQLTEHCLDQLALSFRLLFRRSSMRLLISAKTAFTFESRGRLEPRRTIDCQL